MRFQKKILIDMGESEMLQLEISDADSFEQCDEQLSKELTRLDLDSRMVKT